MCGHRCAYKHFIESNHSYQSSFEIFKEGNAEIELIEPYVCENKNQLDARENYWIQKLDTVNKRGRNLIDSVNDRKSYMKEYHKIKRKVVKVSKKDKLELLIRKKENELKVLKEQLSTNNLIQCDIDR
jgi:hypothetical protein